MSLSFIDTHAHLDGEEFRDDLDAVIKRAHEAGVDAVFVPSINTSSLTTVMMTGISTTLVTARRFKSLIGAFRTMPMAPWPSASCASESVRSPFVVPPPQPQKTGI